MRGHGFWAALVFLLLVIFHFFQSTEEAHSKNLPIILILKQRHQTITLKAGKDGPRYSVKTNRGKVLANDLTASEFERSHPKLFKRVKSALAHRSGDKDVSEGTSMIDASVDRKYLDPSKRALQ